MKSNFKFSNLCGTVYRQGNVIFTPDGNSVLSPVGNRVSVFDLVNNKSFTFPFENRKNIARIALSPDSNLLLSVDEEGHALLSHFHRHVVLHHFNFKKPVRDIQFSPDGRYIAATHGAQVQVWKTPSSAVREFSPFVLHRTYTGHFDDVLSVTWSKDGRFFMTTSKDMTGRLFSLDPVPGFRPKTFGGHRDHVLGAWFSDDGRTIYTVSRDGAAFVWKAKADDDADSEQEDDDDEDSVRRVMVSKKGSTSSAPNNTIAYTRWGVHSKHYFQQPDAKVVCATFHAASSLLIVGFSSGIFGLWEMPSFTNVHTLSISQDKITSVAVNASGEWLAFGARKLGQLLVWEWQSESYVLKQQGHFFDMNCLAFSSDGQTVATGGDDGKVKVWNTTSGFCFITFSEHTSSISALEFAKQGSVLFSASLDGTVRAFDLVRYRNFRTFTSPSPVQFSSLAVDPSGEVVCAGSIDTFEIFLWSVQTGKLLDILAGHEGPVASLAFSPTGSEVASASWDRTVRLWEVFGRSRHVEPFQLNSDGLAVAFRPDGKEVAASTLDGQIGFWDVSTGNQKAVIEGRKDVAGGRKAEDKIIAANNSSGKSFNSLCYSADGKCVLAGGNSKYVVLYDAREGVMVKKFQISQNLSLDGTREFLDSRKVTDAGVTVELIDDQGDESDLEDRMDDTLPGAKGGNLSRRRWLQEARTKCVRFSPTGRSWAAASTEGLLVYSLDESLVFDPFDLDIDITPQSTLATLERREYLQALVMSLRLNEAALISRCYEGVPPSDIPLLASQLPTVYLEPMLRLVATHMEKSPHVEFHLRWVGALLTSHGKMLRERSGEYASIFRIIQRSVTDFQTNIARLCDDNRFSLLYLWNGMQATAESDLA